MNHLVIFRATARQDLLDVRDWYERQRVGLGDRFVASVDRTLATISKSPESFPLVHRDARRALVRPFPYGIFYRVRSEAIHVLAVLHGRRDPMIWKSRADADG